MIKLNFNFYTNISFLYRYLKFYSVFLSGLQTEGNAFSQDLSV